MWFEILQICTKKRVSQMKIDIKTINGVLNFHNNIESSN